MALYNIKPEGSKDAKIAVVAEKPAEEESLQHRLLIGTTGRSLRRHLNRAGLSAGDEIWGYKDGLRQCLNVTFAQDVWLTNAVQSYNDPRSNPTVADIIREQPRLYSELAALRNLRCIIAVGNAALASVANFSYSRQNKDGELTGILLYRGSVLETPLRVKTVPTVHPSFYVHGQWRYRSIVQHDINRAVEESHFSETRRTNRRYYIRPTFDQALRWIRQAGEGEWLEHDVETFQWPRKKRHPYTGKLVDSGTWYISCISFSNNPLVGWCVPITHSNRTPYWSAEQELVIWKALAQLFKLKHKTYCGQNQLFDLWHERKHGIVCPSVSQQGADSMYMHRLRAADLPHDLGFLTSIYPEPPEPYYKDESGRWDSDITVPEDQFWTYSAKDSAIGLDVTQRVIGDLKENGMWDYYREYMQPQFDVLLDMRCRGMHISSTRLLELRKVCNDTIREHSLALQQTVGWIPNTKSSKDMAKLLDSFGVRYRTTEKSGQARIREEDLYTYAHRYPEARDAIIHCVKVTNQRTYLSNFLYPALDQDDFYHPSYDLSHAKNGRLSSEGADEGGFQAQNLPGFCRLMVTPDSPECELTKADLAQADARCVAWDAQDDLAIKCFEAGYNMHKVRACTIFKGWSQNGNLPPIDLLDTISKRCVECVEGGVQDCNHTQYFISKQAGHAGNYGMGWRHWIEDILPPFDVWIEQHEAQRILALAISRAVRAWQDRSYVELCQSPWVESPCGRRREIYGYPGAKPDAKIHREVLSWKGSVCVGHVTNLAMVRLHDKLQALQQARVITQTHDSVLINHRKADRERVYDLVRKAFECPLSFHGRVLNIPVEIGSGQSWGEAR